MLETDDLISEINALSGKLSLMKSDAERCGRQVFKYDAELGELAAENELLLETREYYRKTIDTIYERSIGELKVTLNTAISFVFPDKMLEVDIILNDKRGKSLSLVISSNGKVVSLKDGMGMGVNCVISAILHIYYLQCKGSKILMLDESYHNISVDYIARFFEFIEKLCKSLNFKLILITHDERVISYADKVFVVCDGQVSEGGKIGQRKNKEFDNGAESNVSPLL